MARRTQPLRHERIGLPLKDNDPDTQALKPLFEEYLAAKRAELSEGSVKALRHPFGLFCRWLVEQDKPLVLASFTLPVIEAYRDNLSVRPPLAGRRGFDGEHLSEPSQHAYLRPLRQFAGYLAWAGWVEISPFELSFGRVLPSLERSQRNLKLTDPVEVRALLDATRGDDPLALRDHAILLVAWETGMRTQDVCRLDLESINLRTGEIVIVDSKGDKDRAVKIGELALPALVRYLGIGRPRLVIRGERRLRGFPAAERPGFTALFLSEAAGGQRNPGGRLTVNGVYQLLSRRARQAGLRRSFGAHRFRHGLATLLTEANVSVDVIAQWLGDSIETIRKTYSHPTARAMHAHIGPIVSTGLLGAGYRPAEAA
jgi:site-specific recombinase XerD